MLSKFKSESKIKECFHHKKSECQGDIKQSHSIQRNGRLSIIEEEVNGNQMIYTFTSHIPSKQRAFEDLKPIGKATASTFFGFCDFHDTNIFSPIENYPFDDSDKHLFLHSYRAFAHSYHRKKEEHKLYNDPKSQFTKNFPPAILMPMRLGLEAALKDAVPYKSSLDNALENENYDFLNYLVYEKEGLYPFAVSSQMSPPTTYKNKPMNNHMDPNIPFSIPLITFLPDHTSTIAIIAAFPDDQNSITLLDELNSLNDLQLEKAITSLIIANCENTFFSPKVWNSLSTKEKRALLDESESTTMAGNYEDRFFHSKFNFFDDRFNFENLK